MKKLIMLVIILVVVSVFAEKLTTNGKSNLNYLQGDWENGTMKILKRNNRWYAGFLDFNFEDPNNDYKWYEIKFYKNGVFVIPNYYSEYNVQDKNYYFAWDTKRKTMVEVDRNFNIISVIKRKTNKPIN